MTYDTLETAFAKARDAQKRGVHTVELWIEARRHTMALRVDVASYFTDGKDCGADALVVRRLNGEPYHDPESGITLRGKVETLIVRASVTDILELARFSVEREMRPLSPVTRATRRRSLAHLTSR